MPPWIKPSSLLILLPLLLIVGCARKTPPPWEAPSLLGGKRVEDPRFLVEALKEREEGFHDLSALAEVAMRRGTDKVKAKEVILMERGSKLRLEALGLFGQPIVYFNIAGDEVSLFYPANGKFYRGNVYSRGLVRWLGVDLRVEEVVSLLSGNIVIPAPNRNIRAIHYPDQKAYRLLFSTGSISDEMWMDDSNLFPIRRLRSRDGIVTLEARFSSYQPFDGYPFPQEIRIRRPLDDVEITLKYDQIEVNAGLPETAFQLQPPEGVEVIYVE